MLKFARLLLPLLLCLIAPAQVPSSLREQARIQDRWLDVRLEQVLPKLMREHGVQMWVVAAQEYNEDPVYASLVPATELLASRRSILVFFDPGGGRPLERFVVGRNGFGGRYTVLKPEENGGAEATWDRLVKLIREKQPKTLAVDRSETFNLADGLKVSEWERLKAALGPELTARVVTAECLAVAFLAARLPEMLPTYRDLMRIVHAILREGFSSAVVQPGVTTTRDVEWWMRQKALSFGFPVWFQPDVDVQRPGGLPEGMDDPVIQRGDLLHCDFGLTAMRLNTDTQHMAYVLKADETDAPEGLRKAFLVGQRLQDILCGHLVPGRTGNAVLLGALAQMKAEGITGSIYSHPIGEHGHGAGPMIGRWDQQRALPGLGDLPVRSDTWFSVELQVSVPVSAWGGQPVKMMLEEDISIDAQGRVTWVLARQDRLLLVK